MEIDHGRFESRMAQVLLNHPEIDARFEQMGRIGVSQGMNGHPSLFNSCRIPGLPESPLDTVDGHRALCGSRPFPLPAQGGEYQFRVAMGRPIFAKQLIGRFWKGNKSVFRPFPVNFQYLSCAINLRDFKPQAFLKSETAGIDCNEVNIIVKSCNKRKDFPDFLDGQDFWKFLRALGPDDVQQMPITL